MILGGGLEVRRFAAANLYQQGYAPEVLVANVKPGPREYSRRDWWRHEERLISFQNEVIKFGYYHIKYRVVLSHHGH